MGNHTYSIRTRLPLHAYLARVYDTSLCISYPSEQLAAARFGFILVCSSHDMRNWLACVQCVPAAADQGGHCVWHECVWRECSAPSGRWSCS